MIETLGFLLLIFICLYFDKREELKREKERNKMLRKGDLERYAALDSGEE